MKKGLVTTIVVAVVALGIFGWIKNNYNGMIEGEEGVRSAWSQVENVYQRRADLIPNLVATVKGYATHESGTLEAVVNARAKATQVTVILTSLQKRASRNSSRLRASSAMPWAVFSCL